MIYSYCRVKKCSNKTTVLAGYKKERRTMAKLEITVDVADEGILGKIAKVEEARGALNAAISDLENCFTAKYGNYYSNPAKIKETPANK